MAHQLSIEELQRKAAWWRLEAEKAESYRTAAGFTYAAECWARHDEIAEEIDALADRAWSHHHRQRLCADS